MAAGSLPISVCGNTTPIFMEVSSAAARYDAGRQRLDVGVDVARAREPHAVAVLENVLQRATQTADAIGTAEHERVERDRAHQRLAGRRREHHGALIYDDVG